MATRGRPRKERPAGMFDSTVWAIRDVDPELRRAVKMWALLHDQTTGQAVTELLDAGIRAKGGVQMRSGEFIDKDDGSLNVFSVPSPEEMEQVRRRREAAQQQVETEKPGE